jgi:tetratricopeptide (TPR) repeat protein
VHQLTEFLRVFIYGVLGRRRISRKRRHHRRDASRNSSREHPQERIETDDQNWFVRRDIGLKGLSGLAVALVAMLWIGWRIVADTAAQGLASSNPDAALSWVAHEPAALDQLAQQELPDPDGDLDAARGWAQQALRSDPLDAQALTLLGLIAERKGDHQKADVLMRIAGARTWRDEATQAWLYNRNVRRGDYVHALPHIDAMIRVDPESESRLFPVLASLTLKTAAFKALTDFLAASPTWRKAFLDQLSAQLADQSRLVELYAMLGQSDNPPTKTELVPYLDRLVRDGAFTQAHKVWLDTLPPKLRTIDTHPFNRDFELPLDGLPFNWVFTLAPGADIQIVPSPDSARKRVLRVQFSGARVHFANVKQLMLLAPGDYNFSGRLKTEDLQTSRGLWWRIFCADDPDNTLAHTELASGTVPWTDFTVAFQVPAENCKAQWLQLELPARIESENQIEGQVWYQYLQISVRTPGPPAAD